MTSPPTIAPQSRDLLRGLGRLLVGLVLVTAIAARPTLATDLGAVGLLWLPDGVTASTPAAVVIALHESTGVDPRGWHYVDQLTGAGIAVLHLELLENSADGFVAPAASDDAALARARLALAMDLLARDSRVAGAPVGLLAFGSAGHVALQAAADPVQGGRIFGLALLYPGCAALAAVARAERTRPRSPVLLLHGDADPVNPPADCGNLADQLARSAPVRRIEYAGAGYAWDLAPYGLHEAVKLPWPGSPGLVVAVRYWPQLTELTATQVASFFAAGVVAYRQ